MHVKQEDGGECLLHVYECGQPESSWHAGLGQRLSTAHLHKDWAALYRLAFYFSLQIKCGTYSKAPVNVFSPLLQVLLTANSWTCCFPGAYCWKKSSLTPNWNTNTSTTLRFYRLRSREWMWTRWDRTRPRLLSQLVRLTVKSFCYHMSSSDHSCGEVGEGEVPGQLWVPPVV